MKKPPCIMVVDDDRDILTILSRTLELEWFAAVTATDGSSALTLLEERCKPDLVILDAMMPGMDGYAVAERLKQRDETRTIPIIMVTALREVRDRVKAWELGVDGFLTKPVERIELMTMVNSLLKVKAYRDHMRHYQRELETEVARRTGELQQAFEKTKAASLDTIYCLSRAAEYKDGNTGAHIQRVGYYASAIARRMGLDSASVESILHAAPMHDVGKVGIPDRILQNPGKLNSDEWGVMKNHTLIGAEILSGSDAHFIKLAEVIALTHHEKWDGSGYPGGLRGTDIPVAGHITAIADVFDALTSKRPYKEAYSAAEALDIIQEERGSHFAPGVVDAFFAIKDEILSIKERYRDQGESAGHDGQIDVLSLAN